MKARLFSTGVAIRAGAFVVPLVDAKGPSHGGQNNGSADQAELSQQEEHYIRSVRSRLPTRPIQVLADEAAQLPVFLVQRRAAVQVGPPWF